MLDIFAACAGVAAVLFVVLDAEAISPPPSRSRLVRPWLGAAGVAAGIAVATKWSGVLVVAVIVLLVLAREAAQVRRTGGPALSGLRTAMPTVIGYLIVLPAAVYVLSYAGRVPGELAALPWEEHAWIRAFVERQRDMLAFHTGLDATHPYASPAWSWLLGKRPVVYLLEPGDAGSVREILAFANPLIWVPGMVAAIAAGIAVIRKRMRWGPEVVIMAAVMGTYLPWVILATGRSQVFVYYILPTLPFLAVALGWAAAQLSPRVGRVVAGGLAAISVGVLIFWSPLIYGWPLDREAWRSRVIFTDCGEWTEMLTRPLPERPSGPPPPGWCWI
jgi:dolichyl-phosphate-mannose--protein O-mannosyl transferase